MGPVAKFVTWLLLIDPVALRVHDCPYGRGGRYEAQALSPEQIVLELREANRLLGEGTPLVEVCKHMEVTEATHYRWRNQYGGMKADDAKRLKELEKENVRLKRLVADQALDIDMLKEVNRGNF